MVILLLLMLDEFSKRYSHPSNKKPSTMSLKLEIAILLVLTAGIMR